MVGIVVQGHRIGVGEAFHLVRVEIQQVGLLVVPCLPPFRQVGHAGDGVGDDGVVEVEQVLVADGLRHLAGAARVVGRVFEDVAVPHDEIVVGEPLLDVAFHQALADEEVACLERVDAPPLHGAVLHDRQAVQEHLRARHGRAARTGPVRIRVRGTGECSGERLRPCGINLRGIPRPQPACLHQFGAHHPLRGRLGYGGGGEQGEMRAARALIVVLRHLLRAFHRTSACRTLQTSEIGCLRLARDLHAHHGQQAGKHGRVDALRVP